MKVTKNMIELVRVEDAIVLRLLGKTVKVYKQIEQEFVLENANEWREAIQNWKEKK
jgi:hypothetical protein